MFKMYDYKLLRVQQSNSPKINVPNAVKNCEV